MALSTPFAFQIVEVSVCPPDGTGDSILISLYERKPDRPILYVQAEYREQAENLIYALEQTARMLTRELEKLPRSGGPEIPCETRRQGEIIARRGILTDVELEQRIAKLRGEREVVA